MKLKKKEIISIIIVVLLVIFITTFSILLNNNKPGIKMMVDFESRVDKLNTYDTDGLQKYGWLQVQGTSIDLPILSDSVGGNIDFNYGWITTGSIGYKTRKVIVGHNVLNVSNTPMVNNPLLTNFEDLMSFVYYDFANENMYLSYTENGEDKIFVIYGIGFYDYNYDSAQGLNEKNEINNYIKQVKKNSIYKYDVDVNSSDNLITIKTCTRYFGLYEKQQFIIDAREVRKGEEIIKYNVTKTKLYNEYELKDSYSKNNSIY